MNLNLDKVKRKRLQDANLREGRDDPKRVYLLKREKEDRDERREEDKSDQESDKWVEVSFAEVTEKTEERFEFLADSLRVLAEKEVAVPTVEEELTDQDELRLIVSYEGESLLDQIKEGKEFDLSQVADIFKKMDQIGREKAEFILPRPFEKFCEMLERKEGELEPNLQGSLEDLRKDIEKFSDSFNKEYKYGWGVIDPDIINFTADDEGKISLIDIDGLKKSYDYYYQAGYFWVSLGRLKNEDLIEDCRKEFASFLDFSRSDAVKRFKMGKVGALLINIEFNDDYSSRIKRIRNEMWE